MLGNLLFRKVAPSELNNMSYHELRYWNCWHKAMDQAEKDAIEEAKKKK